MGYAEDYRKAVALQNAPFFQARRKGVIPRGGTPQTPEMSPIGQAYQAALMEAMQEIQRGPRTKYAGPKQSAGSLFNENWKPPKQKSYPRRAGGYGYYRRPRPQHSGPIFLGGGGGFTGGIMGGLQNFLGGGGGRMTGSNYTPRGRRGSSSAAAPREPRQNRYVQQQLRRATEEPGAYQTHIPRDMSQYVRRMPSDADERAAVPDMLEAEAIHDAARPPHPADYGEKQPLRWENQLGTYNTRPENWYELPDTSTTPIPMPGPVGYPPRPSGQTAIGALGSVGQGMLGHAGRVYKGIGDLGMGVAGFGGAMAQGTGELIGGMWSPIMEGIMSAHQMSQDPNQFMYGSAPRQTYR